MAETDKQKALSAALSQIEKQFGKGSIMRMNETQVNDNLQVISTGSLRLDMALGVGGLPRGRVVEIYGPESSGKTTLCLQVVAEAQKLGIPLIGVVDSNHSPEGISYVIPGNDDSAKAVALYARGIADAIIEGRANAVTDVVKAVAAAETGDEFVEVNEAAA